MRFRLVWLFKITTVMCAWMLSAPVQAITCPESPNRVKPKVTATVTRDPVTQLYTYRYAVANALDSVLDIENLYVDIVGTVSDITSPQGWTYGIVEGETFAVIHPQDAVGWNATDEMEVPVGSNLALPPPLYPIKRGTSMSGFSFKSPKPPGPAKFYAAGYMATPPVASEEESETIIEECPKEAVGPLFASSYQGITQGPVNFLPVTITIRQKSLNPKSQGVIPVAILSTADFDAATVDPLSVRFGSGQAPESHGKGHGEDVNGDGKRDLVLHFDMQASGILCGDTSATLTGNTYSGQGIQGTDSFVTVGCK